MENSKFRVVMLCGNSQSSRIMYNGLASDVNIECVILENKPAGKSIIQRRLTKLGVIKTIGQLLFLLINKLIVKTSQSRIKQLMSDYGLNDNCIPIEIIKQVDSVNSEITINILKEINPDAIVVNGTRIISINILSSIDVPFINTHMGITPKYRGVHGGYWALASGDTENCGVTVHLVDQGIDTGGVLYQDIIHADDSDNFNTYPIHQIAKAIPLMKAALNDVREKRINVKEGVLPSKLWTHPTLLEYVNNLIQKRVR